MIVAITFEPIIFLDIIIKSLHFEEKINQVDQLCEEFFALVNLTTRPGVWDFLIKISPIKIDELMIYLINQFTGVLLQKEHLQTSEEEIGRVIRNYIRNAGDRDGGRHRRTKYIGDGNDQSSN